MQDITALMKHTLQGVAFNYLLQLKKKVQSMGKESCIKHICIFWKWFYKLGLSNAWKPIKKFMTEVRVYLDNFIRVL